jgi:gamma-glutamyltranspeptidase/glutathione hydrolase
MSASRPLAFSLAFALMLPQARAAQPVYARHGMVVAQEPLAAEVGVEVLKSGGNAVDAAVAVGFALAVTHPFAGNLGGGGFMLLRMADGRTSFIDFRETAPAAASHDMYLDAKGNPTKDSIDGWRAVAVPGTVAGLELAHRRYGSKTWASLVAPAAKLARDGFPISHSQMESLKSYTPRLSRDPESKRIFLNGGKLYTWHQTFRQPDLAATLQRIQMSGSRDFYRGKTAQLIAAAMRKNGGLITRADLEDYKAIERKPLEGDYKGSYHIITSPPPSSGGAGILQMLGILQGTGYEKYGAGSAEAYHYEAEAMRRYYADRNAYLGDPAFVTNPTAELTSTTYEDRRRASIHLDKATPADQIAPGLPADADDHGATPHEGGNTTHFSIVDKDGDMVGVTYTLNNGYGAAVTVPGAGFLLNDEMDDFAAKPNTPNMFGLVQGERNSIAPGKRPLSSMTPTILLKDNKPYLVLGAPGGSTIITAVLQVIENDVDFGMNIQDAVDFPRIHDQWKPDRLEFEKDVSPDTLHLLANMGYPIEPSHPAVLARVEAIAVENGWLEGAHDPRGSGRAAGY